MNETIRQAEQLAAASSLDGTVLIDLSTRGRLVHTGTLAAVHGGLQSAGADGSRSTRSCVGRRGFSVAVVGNDGLGSRSGLASIPRGITGATDAAPLACGLDADNGEFTQYSRAPEDRSRATGRDDDPMAAWLGAVTLAVAEGTGLWVDDVGLRDLARNEGARVFGTAALIDALVSRGSVTATERDSILETLRDEYCVDLPLDPSWLESPAARDEWRSGVALFAFSRSASWADLQQAFELWRRVVGSAGASGPELVAAWVYSRRPASAKRSTQTPRRVW